MSDKTCLDIQFGSLDCCYNIMLPYLVGLDKTETKNICIDKCLLPEILSLWEAGIKTGGCCCGHGDKLSAFISVNKECVNKMENLGYKRKINPPQFDQDEFYPKTKLEYGTADKGFNWWET